MIKSLEGFAPYAPYLIPLTGLAFHELGHFLCGRAKGDDKSPWRNGLQGIAMLVRNHVQGCFSKERDLAEQVAIAGSVQEVESVEW